MNVLGRGCFVLCLAFSTPTWAQAENQAAARALFEEARKLARSGDYAAACPKFEAANRLYTSPGALLNLGDCHEHLELTASAWAEFADAAAEAARTGRTETADEARRRQHAIEPRLMRLVIRVPQVVPGLVVERDGIALGDAAWGARLPIDPGTHRVAAHAPGHHSWSSSVELSKAGQTVTLDVPALLPLGPDNAAVQGSVESSARISDRGHAGDVLSESVSASVPPDTASQSSHALQWTLIGGGAAVATGAAVLMFVQVNRANTSREQDDPALYDSTRTPWTIGLIGVIAGAASAVAGSVWLLSDSPDEGNTALAAEPWVAPYAAGLDVRGTW